MTEAHAPEDFAARVKAAWRIIRASSPGPVDEDPVGDATPTHVRSPEPEEHERLIDLAERSYKEVLDATKHQDDKVGRFLTAIAFLTTGAITLIASGGALRRHFDVPSGGDHPLLAWSTGAFFALTIAAVALLLLCLSVPVRLPKTSYDPMRWSHLFYSYIANRPKDEWVAHWSSTDEKTLEVNIAKDYFQEAHNLAERTSAKYRHSYEASWLFVCALLFLGVSIYLRVIAEFDTDVDASTDLGVGYLVGLAVIASIHALLQIYTRWVHDVRSVERARDYDDRDHPPAPLADPSGDSTKDPVKVFQRNVANYRQRRWTLSLLVSTTTFSMVLAIPFEDVRYGRTYALVAVGLTTLIPTWLTRQIWNADQDVEYSRLDWRSWWFPLLATAGAGGVACAALYVDGVWRVSAILLPPLVTGFVNLSRPAHSHWLARRLKTDTSAPSSAS